MSYIGRKYSLSDIKKPNKTTLIIDEFASFATKEFIGFMDRARGAGIGLVLAHQNRSDLEAIEAGFQKRLESNANTKIVSGIDDAKDAEYYAAMIGTRLTTAETWQEESQLFGGSLATGLKSVREVQEYRVHPNQIKELKQGQVFIYSKSVDVDYGIVNTHLPKEPKIQLQENEVRSFFELRRKNAMTETKIKLIELKVNHNASQEPDPNVQMNSSKQLTSDLWA